MNTSTRLLALALTAAAAGCTTPAYVSPVEVTRFTGNLPPIRAFAPPELVAAE